MERFGGRTAIVTGAASGIGRATARRLAAEGAAVVAVDVGGDGLDALAKDVADDGGIPPIAVVGDVGDPATAEAAMAIAIDRLGRIDVLANVAGILRTARTHEHDLDLWDQVLRVNLTGTFLFCRTAIPHLLAAGGGTIVNTSSTAALSGHPWAAAYSASKGGVLAFTRVLAVEYARHGIRANCVCPGSIDTPITGDFVFPDGLDAIDHKLIYRQMALGRPGAPETVAGAIAFLASDDAAHVTGTELRVDGGTLA